MAVMEQTSYKVLLVDDEAAVGQVLKTGLEHCGLVVRYEPQSTDAVKACLEFQPNLVLLDIDMPVKDGGQVAADLRNQPTLAKIPVIFLSSLVNKEEAGRRNASREMMLSKQIHVTELAAVVRQVLEGNAAAPA
jgi:CheY-like chemotaxis protein